ncbi:MAG TPA: 1-pyrroline-5-carboxylate dehydrogenase, partial [Candidatus Binatia bacterium]|nr:1-pyrroline-5-carboxylate dehydrogenase [Candidatus Binatia bacterium]
MSSNGAFRPPAPANEPVRSYAPDTPERAALQGALRDLSGQTVDIPLVIGGQAEWTGATEPVVMPHDTSHVLGQAAQGGPAEMEAAIAAAERAS